jgi:hypothetical protein
MVWQPEIDELKHRRHLAEQMGGKEGIKLQHAQGTFKTQFGPSYRL